ncbi:MAG: hypothetical protein MI867_10550, partial [Pseudomonadales bacterium]|nr:hypothetical protein [Pseudomonadales bacterium]
MEILNHTIQEKVMKRGALVPVFRLQNTRLVERLRPLVHKGEKKALEGLDIVNKQFLDPEVVHWLSVGPASSLVYKKKLHDLVEAHCSANQVKRAHISELEYVELKKDAAVGTLFLGVSPWVNFKGKPISLWEGENGPIPGVDDKGKAIAFTRDTPIRLVESDHSALRYLLDNLPEYWDAIQRASM